MRRGLAAALCSIVLCAGVAQAETFTRSGSRRVGNDRFGGSLTRTMVARHAGRTGALECRTSVNARVVGRTYRAARVSRRVEGRDLGLRALETTFFQVELVGRGGFRVGPRFTKAIEVARFQVPVPVGPFQVKLRGSVGAYLELRATVGIPNGSVEVGLEGSVALGGRLGVGVGIPGGTVGVEGQLSLIKGGLPATARMRRTGVTFNVAFVVSSEVEVYLFAEVGFGPFKKQWRLKLPFLVFSFAKRRIPLASHTVRG